MCNSPYPLLETLPTITKGGMQKSLSCPAILREIPFWLSPPAERGLSPKWRCHGNQGDITHAVLNAIGSRRYLNLHACLLTTAHLSFAVCLSAWPKAGPIFWVLRPGQGVRFWGGGGWLWVGCAKYGWEEVEDSHWGSVGRDSYTA